MFFEINVGKNCVNHFVTYSFLAISLAFNYVMYFLIGSMCFLSQWEIGSEFHSVLFRSRLNHEFYEYVFLEIFVHRVNNFMVLSRGGLYYEPCVCLLGSSFMKC